MKKILIIFTLIFTLTSCFNSNDKELENSNVIGKKITQELGGVSGSGEITISNAGPSPIDFKN